MNLGGPFAMTNHGNWQARYYMMLTTTDQWRQAFPAVLRGADALPTHMRKVDGVS